MSPFKQRIGCALAALLLSLGGGLAAAAPTQADVIPDKNGFWIIDGAGSRGTSCEGKLLKSYPVASGKAVISIYYSPVKNGTNCAIAYNKTGTARKLGIGINLSATGYKDRAYNYGKFSSYAGAVKVSGTNGKCIDFSGGITYAGKDYIVGRDKVFCN